MADVYPRTIKLHEELINAGLPVVSVSSDGRIDTEKPLGKNQQTKLQEVLAAHDPGPTDFERWQERLNATGITSERIIWALWQRVMLDDPAPADQLLEIINELYN